MFTSKDTGRCAIDSLSAREGKFTVNVVTGQASIEVLMVYSNRGSGDTCGTCPVRNERLSEKTKQVFAEFIRGAEEDFGTCVLKGGFLEEAPGVSALGSAESNQGIRPRGLGEG